MSLYSHSPTIRHLERFCADHLGKHDSYGLSLYYDFLSDLTRKKGFERRRKHDNDGLFGMSKAGGCLRAATLSRAGVKGIKESGSTQATFAIGDLLECMALAILEASGFEVTDTQGQVRYADTFCSAVDGVLRSGPVDLPYPIILSVKTASYKMSYKGRRNGFAALPLDGVEKSHPSWFVQSQLEMAGSINGAEPIQHSLIVVIAKDMVKSYEGDAIFEESGSLTFYVELLRSVPGLGAALQAFFSGADFVADPSIVVPMHYGPGRGQFVRLPKPGDDNDWGGPNRDDTGLPFNPCRGCSYRMICKEGGAE